jgi:hypothetical protein
LISEHARERVRISYEDYLDYVKRHYEGIPIGEPGHFLRNYNYWGLVSMKAFSPHSLYG